MTSFAKSLDMNENVIFQFFAYQILFSFATLYLERIAILGYICYLEFCKIKLVRAHLL